MSTTYIVVSSFYLVFLTLFVIFLLHRMEAMKGEIQTLKRNRKKLYEKLADPIKIEQDMEKSARAREMRDANRTFLPRHDGPPAKVHRPKMRGAKPGNWRVQRP